MAQRATVNSTTWAQIGTGPAIVQLISPSGSEVEVLVECQTASPSGVDGLVLNGNVPIIKFNLAQAIWAAVLNAGQSAVVNVQPDVAG